MYNPSHFAETDTATLHAFLQRHSLATLITTGLEGPEASHVPTILHPEMGPQGVLRCHLARANSHWKALANASPVLAIFHGPEHYITPSWYPTKQETGKVVPTWNYVAVHVRGRAAIFEDASEMVQHLKALTAHNEGAFTRPWSVDDAPAEYITALTKAIIGIEITISSIEGKWKASQNRSGKDRQGVIEGLGELDTASSRQMAAIVRDRNR